MALSDMQRNEGLFKKVAQSFSNMMAVKMGWSRYGDPNYVDHVMRYLKSLNHDFKLVNGSINEYEIVMKEASKYEGQPYVWGALIQVLVLTVVD